MGKESSLIKAQKVISESFNNKFPGVSSLVDAYNKEEEQVFIAALRVKAYPPIKGEITRAKIQWRGIEVCQQIKDGQAFRWLTQRGRVISPKVIVDMPNFNELYK